MLSNLQRFCFHYNNLKKECKEIHRKHCNGSHRWLCSREAGWCNCCKKKRKLTFAIDSMEQVIEVSNSACFSAMDTLTHADGLTSGTFLVCPRCFSEERMLARGAQWIEGRGLKVPFELLQDIRRHQCECAPKCQFERDHNPRSSRQHQTMAAGAPGGNLRAWAAGSLLPTLLTADGSRPCTIGIISE